MVPLWPLNFWLMWATQGPVGPLVGRSGWCFTTECIWLWIVSLLIWTLGVQVCVYCFLLWSSGRHYGFCSLCDRNGKTISLFLFHSQPLENKSFCLSRQDRMVCSCNSCESGNLLGADTDECLLVLNIFVYLWRYLVLGGNGPHWIQSCCILEPGYEGPLETRLGEQSFP